MPQQHISGNICNVRQKHSVKLLLLASELSLQQVTEKQAGGPSYSMSKNNLCEEGCYTREFVGKY